MDSLRRLCCLYYGWDKDEWVGPPASRGGSQMVVKVVKVGPCGGAGGGERDMNVTGVTRIVKVLVRHGAIIEAVSFFYERNGNVEWSPQWGGGGSSLSEINLAQHEYFTSINGHYGYYGSYFVIKSLTFVSNLHVYGPYGRQEGIAFALPAGNGKIIGFHARSDSWLDAIGTYVQTN